MVTPTVAVKPFACLRTSSGSPNVGPARLWASIVPPNDTPQPHHRAMKHCCVRSSGPSLRGDQGGVFLSLCQAATGSFPLILGSYGFSCLSMARIRSQRRRATQITAALCRLPSSRLRW